MQTRLINRICADTVTVFHFLWAILVFGGTALMFLVRWYAPFQIAVLTITAIANIPLQGTCPLALLEERLRQKLDPAYTNNGSFTTTYLNKILKANFSVRNVNIFIVVFYILSYCDALWLIAHP